MCDCRKNIETKLTDRFKKQAPEASGHGVSLQGYAFALTDTGVISRPYMPYKATAEHPLKKGGTKVKSETGNMFFSFCPFCGEKIKTD